MILDHNSYPQLADLASTYIANNMSPRLAFSFNEGLKEVVAKTTFDVVSLTFRKMHKVPMKGEVEAMPLYGETSDPFEGWGGPAPAPGKKLKKKTKKG